MPKLESLGALRPFKKDPWGLRAKPGGHVGRNPPIPLQSWTAFGGSPGLQWDWGISSRISPNDWGTCGQKSPNPIAVLRHLAVARQLSRRRAAGRGGWWLGGLDVTGQAASGRAAGVGGRHDGALSFLSFVAVR